VQTREECRTRGRSEGVPGRQELELSRRREENEGRREGLGGGK